MSPPTKGPNWETLVILSDHWTSCPTIVALASCVCKSWHAIMTREHLWKKICLDRWPSLSTLSKPPSISYRRFYSLRHLCRRKSTLSLHQLIFIVDVFSISDGKRYISFTVPGEDLVPATGEEGDFDFSIVLDKKVRIPESKLGVDWAVMLKGWESVVTIIDGGEEIGVLDGFFWIFGKRLGCVSPQMSLRLGFSTSPEKGTLIAEEVKLCLMDGDDFMTIDDSLKYLEHFLLPYQV